MKIASGGGCFYFMEQGTGKTLTSIAVAGRAFLNGKIKKLLVVCPGSVMPVWKNEFESFADYPNEVILLEGPVIKRAETLNSWPSNLKILQVAVVNYESSWRLEEEIKKWNPDMVIYDECHKLSNPGTRQSKFASKMVKKCKYRLGLTGTPITNSPLSLYGQYRAIDPSIFGSSFFAFKARYAVTGGFNGKQVIAFKNLPDLTEKAHRIAYRVKKNECLDLPEYVDQTLYCDLEPKARDIYEQMRKESVAEISAERVVTASNVLTKLLRLSQLTGGFIGDGTGLIEQVSRAKLSLFEEILDDLLSIPKNKVTVFARFIPEMRAIENLFINKKIGYAKIAGNVPMKDRGEEVRRFQNNEDCRVFLGQEACSGLGITLHASSTEILYSLSYSSAELEQVKARIHRPGQVNKCTYIFLVAKDTVDEKILKILLQKKSLADAVMDGWKELF